MGLARNPGGVSAEPRWGCVSPGGCIPIFPSRTIARNPGGVDHTPLFEGTHITPDWRRPTSLPAYFSPKQLLTCSAKPPDAQVRHNAHKERVRDPDSGKVHPGSAGSQCQAGDSKNTLLESRERGVDCSLPEAPPLSLQKAAHGNDRAVARTEGDNRRILLRATRAHYSGGQCRYVPSPHRSTSISGYIYP